MQHYGALLLGEDGSYQHDFYSSRGRETKKKLSMQVPSKSQRWHFSLHSYLYVLAVLNHVTERGAVCL